MLLNNNHPHFPYYKHLIDGGYIFHYSPRTQEAQVINLESLDGFATKIALLKTENLYVIGSNEGKLVRRLEVLKSYCIDVAKLTHYALGETPGHYWFINRGLKIAFLLKKVGSNLRIKMERILDSQIAINKQEKEIPDIVKMIYNPKLIKQNQVA